MIDDLDKVNEAIHAIDTRHTTEAQTLADAKAALHDAKTALRPFDLPFRDALKGVADAKTGVAVARAAVDERTWIGRRPAQQHLATAEVHLANADTALKALTVERHPYLQAVDKAERRLETIVDGARTRDMLDRYEYLPEKHGAALNVTTALDLWHDWATGTNTPAEQVTWAVETFESLGQHPDQQSFKALAEAIRTRTPELINIRTRAIEIELQPELDLGIGL